jgi:hypothetical protein
MDKLTKLMHALDELVAETQRKFDQALAARALAEEHEDVEPRRESVMWAEIEYRDAKRMRDFILETIA